MPNNAHITACSWNREQGYIAAGSIEGLVKVIKLEIMDSEYLVQILKKNFLNIC